MSKKRFEKNQTDIRSRNNSNIGRRGKKKRRRSSYARIALVLTVLAVAAVGIALSLTVFFKIKNVDVNGNKTIYTSKEIIAAGKIEFDSNLIRLDAQAVESRIEKALPYVEEVKLKKVLPTTVQLDVSDATAAGYLKTDSGYATISTKGKVLEISADKPEDLAEISGVTAGDIKVASFVSDENEMLDAIETIYTLLGSSLSRDITKINVTDRINISFFYRDRVEVKLGTESELAEKLKFVALLIADNTKIDSDDMGIIYASNPKRVSFLRKGSYSEYIAEQERIEAEQNASSQIENEGENTSSGGDSDSQNTQTDASVSSQTSSKVTSSRN